MAAIFELEIPSTEKLVLLAMADHARDDGTGAYPSVDLLARKSSMSRRGVQKIMRRLEGDGWIVPTDRFKGGRSQSTEYRITLEKGEPRSLFPPTPGRTPALERANHRAERANLSAEKGEPGSPEPLRTVRKPSGNHQSAPVSGAPASPAQKRPEPFAFSGAHLKVTERQDHLLGEAFPFIGRPAEYRRADAWLEANPKRRPRRLAAFVHNWFSRIAPPPGRERSEKNADEFTRRNAAAAGLF